MPTRSPVAIALLAVLGSLTFLFVVVAGLFGGIGAALMMAGLPLFLLGLGATVVGRARWAFIASRKVGAAVLVAGMVTTGIGGATIPAPTTTSEAVAADPVATGSATTPTTPSTATSTATPTAPNPSTAAATPDAQQQIAAAAPATALAQLGTLAVKGRAPKTGYDRDLFGQRWADTDRNGCDTRNDVLRRDLTGVALKSGTHGCVVLTGTLADPYSGTSISFVRGEGTSELVQIDHVVALSDAWQKGAQQWSASRRLAFANDPLNLLAVQGRLNAQKGDGDAATWLPPAKSYRCAYVARQVAVKAKYGAWVTAAERDAIARVLSTCPDQPALEAVAFTEANPPAAEPAPASATAPAPPPDPAQAPSCDPSYPGVCIPPFSQVGDLDCGDITQRRFAVQPPDPHGFDREHDGIGCES